MIIRRSKQEQQKGNGATKRKPKRVVEPIAPSKRPRRNTATASSEIKPSGQTDEAAQAVVTSLEEIASKCQSGSFDDCRGRRLTTLLREWTAKVNSGKVFAKSAAEPFKSSLLAKCAGVEKIRDFIRILNKAHSSFQETAHAYDLVKASDYHLSAKHCSAVVMLNLDALLTDKDKFDEAVNLLRQDYTGSYGPAIVAGGPARDLAHAEIACKIVASICPSKVAIGVKTEDLVAGARHMVQPNDSCDSPGSKQRAISLILCMFIQWASDAPQHSLN